MSTVSPSLSFALLSDLPQLGVVLPKALQLELSALQGETRLPMAILDALWLEVERQAPPGVGLWLGQRFQPSHYDMTGFLLMSCASIAQAADKLIRYSPLIGQGGSFGLRKQAADVFLHYSPQFNAARHIRVEFILSGVVHGTRWIADSPITPQTVLFEHEAQTDMATYVQAFGCDDIRFGQAMHAVVYHHATWQQTHRMTNAVLQGQMEQLLDAQLQALSPADWLEAATYQLQRQPWITRSQLADALNTSERHVNRKLAEHGMSFKNLAEEVRKRRCEDLLRTSNISQARLADYFGYVDESAFAKAFKRWFGVGFQAYRQAQGRLV